MCQLYDLWLFHSTKIAKIFTLHRRFWCVLKKLCRVCWSYFDDITKKDHCALITGAALFCCCCWCWYFIMMLSWANMLIIIIICVSQTHRPNQIKYYAPNRITRWKKRDLNVFRINIVFINYVGEKIWPKSSRLIKMPTKKKKKRRRERKKLNMKIGRCEETKKMYSKCFARKPLTVIRCTRFFVTYPTNENNA